LEFEIEFRIPGAIASGSLAEVETQLEIACRLGYNQGECVKALSQAAEIGRMLMGLRRSLAPEPKS
jgi:four helix bundle protein